MLDRPLRSILHPLLAPVARRLSALGIRANHLTAAALALAIVAAVLAARHHTVLPAAIWLASRVLDGLDGVLAREHTVGGDGAGGHDADLGGYYDIIGDFAAYAAVPFGVAVAQPDARLAVAALLATYYLSGATFLAYSSLAERRGQHHDERSFEFIGRLAEGTETIAAHTALLLWPTHAEPIAWAFAALVAAGVVERVVTTRHRLRS